jgi:hypothetical protein
LLGECRGWSVGEEYREALFRAGLCFRLGSGVGVLHAFGHERFLAGAGGEAVVKIFDLRMCNTYSYLTVRVAHAQVEDLDHGFAAGSG